jgi:hypothetical protein
MIVFFFIAGPKQAKEELDSVLFIFEVRLLDGYTQ